MRVLHVSHVCGHGGLEALLACLIREQRQHGVEADVYYFYDAGGADTYRGLCNVFFANKQSLSRLLARERYDVVHVATYVLRNVMRCVRRIGYPGAIVGTCHGLDSYDGCDLAHRVTAVSHNMAQKLREHFQGQVSVVSNGLDLSLFCPGDVDGASDRRILAWIGRSDDPVKGFAGFVSMINSERLDFRAVVIDGSAKDEPVLDWLPLGSELYRRVPYSAMCGFYRLIARSRGIVVSTSSFESCGLALLEAQACGCPVVAPSVGGINEVVVDGITGCLYDRKQGVQALSEAIRRLERFYDSACVAAPEHVAANYGSERMCEDYLSVYKDALLAARSEKRSLMAKMRWAGASALCCGLGVAHNNLRHASVD